MLKTIIASACVLCALAGPAAASTFIITGTDGDETKFYFNKKSLAAITGGDSFIGSDIKNNGTDNVDVTTIGTVKNLGNGFGSVDGKDSGSDFLTSLTFTPHSTTQFDGIFFRGQLQDLPGVTSDPLDGDVTITVTGKDGVVTTLTKSGLGIEEDITDLGIEALNDSDLIRSVTIAAGSGEYFKEFKQVTLSGVPGAAVPEPAMWIMLISGFGIGGWMLRRRIAKGQTLAV